MAESSSEEHPLSLELQSLRASVARFQDEAHGSAVKLQRHSLDAVRAHERAVHLERENDVLKSELAVLRAHPPSNGHSLSTDNQPQVEELTLSLRRLSHKLSLTEEALLVANTSLASSQAQSLKASANADNAYELGARVRGREEEALAKERDLEWRVKRLEEELRMSDGVVREYASLVRGMETRSSSDTEALQLEDSLKEGKMGLERLFKELQGECDASERRFHSKHAELEVCQSQLEAERQTKEKLEKELAETRTELAKLKLEDGTAAKMVSRYMQFSQTATNNLLTTLKSLQARHNSTVSTLSSQNHLLSTELRSLENQNERLRATLDELGGEMMKEAYGRRREIAQRIRMGGREDRIVEGLRRWIRRGDEMITRLRGDEGHEESQSHPIDALLDMSQHARILLEGLDNGVLDEESAFSLSGARARETLVRMGVDGLLEELGKETERRIALEKALAKSKYHEISREMEVDGGDEDTPPEVPEKIHPTPNKNLPPSRPLIRLERDTNSFPLSTTIVEGSNTETNGLQFPTPADPVLVPDVETKDKGKNPTLPIDLQPSSSSYAEILAEPTEVVGELQTLETEATTEQTAELSEKSPLPQDIPEPTHVAPIPIEVVEGATNDENPASSFDKTLTTLLVTSQVSSKEEVDNPLPASFDPPEDHHLQETPPLPVNTTPTGPSIPDIHVIVESPSVQKPHPMLAELVRINKRYDDLQRAFRDCHLALESLKAGLGTDTSSNNQSLSHFGQSPSSSSSSTSSTTSLLSPSPASHDIPTHILRAALGRLDDFTEDARVELEIRVGDETLLAKGYEALLSVPGALNAAQAENTAVDWEEVRMGAEDDIPEKSDIEKQIAAFVSGSDSAVRKARDTFAKKLEDVQHDIAALKRAIHDPESLEVFDLAVESLRSVSSLSLSSHPEHTANENGNGNGNGNGWTSWIRGTPSRPSTPLPANASLGPSPTFGSIMTSPRLRHSASNSSFQSQGGPRSRKGSFFGFGVGGSHEQIRDPLAVLSLRVPMPNFGTATAGTTTSGLGSAHQGVGLFGGGYGLMSPTSPLGSASRPRTVSTTMYSLGIGAAHHGTSSPVNPLQMSRSASAGAGFAGHNHNKVNLNFPSNRQKPEELVVRNGDTVVDEEGSDTVDEETEDEDDTDVE